VAGLRYSRRRRSDSARVSITVGGLTIVSVGISLGAGFSRSPRLMLAAVPLRAITHLPQALCRFQTGLVAFPVSSALLTNRLTLGRDPRYRDGQPKSEPRQPRSPGGNARFMRPLPPALPPMPGTCIRLSCHWRTITSAYFGSISSSRAHRRPSGNPHRREPSRPRRGAYGSRAARDRRARRSVFAEAREQHPRP
jgi:hypothetical protein